MDEERVVEKVLGRIEFGWFEDGPGISVDGSVVATVVVHDDLPEDHPLEVSLPDGGSWLIESGVPSHLAGIDDPIVTSWPSRIVSNGNVVCEIEVAVSLLTELPIVINPVSASVSTRLAHEGEMSANSELARMFEVRRGALVVTPSVEA